MIRNRTRRSIVFQLWIRLSVITVSFTLIALSAYLWLTIKDTIDASFAEAERRAGVVAGATQRIAGEGGQPSAQELAIASLLGVVAIQSIDSRGEVVLNLGSLDGETAYTPTAVVDGRPDIGHHYEVRLSEGGFSPAAISALDILRGGKYGAVHTLAPGAQQPDGALRVVTAYEDIAGEARTLLLRALALTGGILTVAVIAMWILLNRFVAAPLRSFSSMALRIAAGEPLRMPEADNNELGNLARAINGMAETLRFDATVDPLTGLYNLRHLHARLETLIAETKALDGHFAVIVCDIDNLKPVNDRHGHAAGDRLLQMFAGHLMRWAGAKYTCWRVGGDEFAAVLPLTTAEGATREAHALEATLHSASIEVATGEVPLRVSMGIAMFPDDSATVAELLETADRRMYAAKALKTRVSQPSPAA